MVKSTADGASMTVDTHVIDGKALANALLEEIKIKVARAREIGTPGLATILVGDDPASQVYVRNKRKRAESVGITSFHHHLPANVSTDRIVQLIKQLNDDARVHAILVQLPLPRHVNERQVLDQIIAKKDVDGFHPLNLGHLLRGDPQVVPCTPQGIMHLIRSVGFDLAGKNAVVVGRSNIVGKPMAQLLLQKDATVTICHSKTTNLKEITKQADIVVAAIGRAKYLDKSYFRTGVFVVDVGMNRDDNNKLCGDVDFDDVVGTASYITPVPGGVGPLTIAMLLQNAFDNFLRIHQ